MAELEARILRYLTEKRDGFVSEASVLHLLTGLSDLLEPQHQEALMHTEDSRWHWNWRRMCRRHFGYIFITKVDDQELLEPQVPLGSVHMMLVCLGFDLSQVGKLAREKCLAITDSDSTNHIPLVFRFHQPLPPNHLPLVFRFLKGIVGSCS